MSGEWTPGPWLVDPLGLGALGDISTPDGSQCVAQSQQVAGDVRNKVRIANAHLIAAAPDLYAALEAMTARMSLYSGHHDDTLTAMGKAALAKARGEA